MSKKTKDLFIFDLDGTLVDAYLAIQASLNHCLDRFGYDTIGLDRIKTAIGHGDRNFVAEFFSKDQVDPALDLYRKHHKQALRKHTVLKHNARWLLYNLKRGRKLLAIASNRPAAYTDIVVKALDIKKYFDFILCADEINSLKPKPRILFEVLKKLDTDKSKALFAGDMDVDMETAKRAKVDAVFVIGGSSSLKQVSGYKDKFIAYDLKDIYPVFK